MLDIEGGYFILSDEATAYVRLTDGFAQPLKDDVDAYLLQGGITPPSLEDDPDDIPDPEAECVSSLRQLNFREAIVSAIIWATGFSADFSGIHLPVLGTEGRPFYQRGISSVRGLCFIGFPWLNSLKSGIILGIGEETRYIVDAI